MSVNSVKLFSSMHQIWSQSSTENIITAVFNFFFFFKSTKNLQKSDA